jgi:hypothetical protein
VRRKRFQRGCVRKVKHGRRWVWIGKYRENGIGRTKVLGHCADLTEGGAWAKLQEHLLPLNERAGQRQGLPTNFRAYVSNVYLPQRRKKWKDSTDQTTTERIQTHLLAAFESFELTDLTRDRLQRFLDQKASSLYVAAWRDISADTGPGALVFPSERATFFSRDNFLRRNIQKKLGNIGLGWVNLQVLRRTQASLGHKEGVDPKVAADQRGHAIGVAIDTYTESDLESRREAVTKLAVALADDKPGARAGARDSSREQGFRGKRGKTDEGQCANC